MSSRINYFNKLYNYYGAVTIESAYVRSAYNYMIILTKTTTE